MSKYDSLLKQAQVYEKLAVYGSRKEFLSAIAQAGELNYTPDYRASIPGRPDDVLPPEPAKAPVHSADPTIVQVQKDLNALNIPGTKGPLSVDGVKGAETQAALNTYRQKNRLRMPPGISDALLYVMIHRDAKGQNAHVDLSGLHQVPKGPVPQAPLSPDVTEFAKPHHVPATASSDQKKK